MEQAKSLFNYPFKFNRSWLNDPAFTDWLSTRWPLLPLGDSVSDLDSLQHKLRTLKNEAKVWIKDKQAQLDNDIHKIEQAITSLLSGSSNGILSTEDMALLTHLRSERKLILNHFLLTWQLKSRTKWALQGDSNTKYFHMLASGRRN